MLVLSAPLLAAGLLGDHFGRRRVLVFGLMLFDVGSLVASQMSSVGGLIAPLGAVMGVGAAPILVLTCAIPPSMFSEGERRRERPSAFQMVALGRLR